jgi:hypothetical protein
MAQIRRSNRIIELEGGDADYQILKWNHYTFAFRFAVDPGCTARDLKRQRVNWHCIEQVVQELLPARGLYSVLSTPYAMLELDHTDGCERDCQGL